MKNTKRGKDKVEVKDFMQATKQETPDGALNVVQRLVTSGARQSFVLQNLASLTIVFSPLGIVHIEASPEVVGDIEGITAIERALLEVQETLMVRKKQLMSKPTKDNVKEDPRND